MKKKIVESNLEKSIDEIPAYTGMTRSETEVKKVKESISVPIIPVVKKEISPDLYSEVEKKLIEYFNAQPINR